MRAQIRGAFSQFHGDLLRWAPSASAAEGEFNIRSIWLSHYFLIPSKTANNSDGAWQSE